ncbi:hypothetical protein [Lysinibacillus varians]|uniref:Uncharacterized protein n=1 Tax=Lysinibacillus varians TaxID=1145276 RepID=A0ABY2T715_9BACI|nr:hypothetical protein [Lysinibacillus varians]AHN24232.1 hypothetical protein T479_12180 [Lysinibacillus varians]TKI52674.1 hypothetical protein FC752_19005 [Lysinibacillus varians]
MIGYAHHNGDGSYALFFDINHVPEWMRPKIEEMTVPEGTGILRKKEDGSFYYEPFQSDKEPPINEPSEEVPPQLQVSVEEMQAQILLNTEYLVSRIELGLGGK